MVDIHTHIIPGIDDGPADPLEMLEMARMAVADGVTTLAATPHAFWAASLNDDAVIRDGVAFVNGELASAGIPLEVVPGCEVPMDRRVLSRLSRNPSWTFGAMGAYLLLEPPWSTLPDDWADMIENFVSSGITPVIAHPERCPDLQRSPALVAKMIDMGCLTQVTANSITGRHGGKARDVALQLLREGRVHVVASDAHNCENRAPVMTHARQQVRDRFGEETAEQLFEHNPRCIVEGAPVDRRPPVVEEKSPVPDEDEQRPGFLGSLFRRRGNP